MTYADQINRIACRWADLLVDVPEIVHVSTDVYDEIVNELEVYAPDTFCSPYSEIRFFSTVAEHRIIVDRKLPPGVLHMNRMTYNSIIVEDILLDDADFDLFDD